MEEILVDDTDEKCQKELTPAAATCSSSSNSTASGSGAEEPRVMSMLYIPQGKLTQDNNNGTVQTPLVHVVNKSQLATFNQIVLQGINQVGQTQLQQPITIRKPVNATNHTNSTSTQAQKHILVRKPNIAGAQIVPISTSTQENQVQAQSGGKSNITYLGAIIKPKSRETLVLPKGQIPTQLPQKLVIAPVISHVAQATSSSSNQMQSQPQRQMTNLILPVSIRQQTTSASKQNINLNFKSNLNLQFTNGQISSDPKSGITVLRDSKESNSTPNPPPLHPIAKMSLLNIPKNSSNSTDSIKISENPDSAVITPIPKKDDSDLPEKRKKTVSNILRGSGEKRVKKQTFPKSSQDSDIVELPSYSVTSSGSESDKDRKKDKESDDDITLIKVIPSEDKKMKRIVLPDDINIEIVKGPNSKDVEFIERPDRMNGKSSNENMKDYSIIHKNETNYESSKVIDWKDNVGSLPGSALKFCMNEFGLMEVVDEKSKPERNGNAGDKENLCFSQNSSRSSTQGNERKAEDKKAKSLSADTFYCCEGCGCHGLASEFESPNSCSASCTEYLEVMRLRKLRKDKEMNKEMRAKKKRKKLLQEQQSKEREKNKDSLLKTNEMDEKSKDSEDTYEKFAEKSKPETDEDTKDTNLSVMDEESQGDSESKHPWQTGKLGFSWSKYLEYTKAKAAPVKLFKDAFPYGKNNFKVGMKLEGIDPNHPSHYCVLSVAEVVGHRIRLHFDGYDEKFDFWVNADSMDIFSVGWAEKNNHKLHPPKGYTQESFNWNSYLKICKATSAPKTLFYNKNSMLPTGFRVGMKLEAVDRKHSSLVCVASVSDVMDSRILVHFDSWDDVYDYWADVNSPYIHPIGWCHHNGHSLTPPNFYKDSKSFSWDAYLKSTGSVAAPARAFKQRPPCGFKRGMKLEAVDKRLPQLIRVATVEDVKDHMIKIRFDGWPENHAYWVDDDSTDIHPVGWCSKTGHPLEPPLTQDNLNDRPECGTYGCKGIGHVKGPKFATHNSASGCPYSPQNLNKIKFVVDRLSLKIEVTDIDDELSSDKTRQEKPERTRSERSERRLLSFEEKPIKIENIKQEDGDSSDKNDRNDSSERLSNKWRNHSDRQSDDDEIFKKRKKRKFNDDSSVFSVLSNNNSSTAQTSYASHIPDKQLRLELYHSVYNPGYNPLPDAPHVWAKHSSALNRIVAKQNTNPRRWSSEEVIKFIQSVPNCREIGNVFRKHNLDGDGFLMLTQEDLVTTMGLKLGPALKLYNSIVLLRKRVT